MTAVRSEAFYKTCLWQTNIALVLILCQSLQEEAATLRNGIDEMRSAFDMDDREL